MIWVQSACSLALITSNLVLVSATGHGMCLVPESDFVAASVEQFCFGARWLFQAATTPLCAGVKTHFGITFRCRAAVLTTGTFMNGRIWVGRASMPAGR